MLIRVKPTTPSRDIIEIELSETDNVLTLKDKIIEKWSDVTSDRLKIIFGGSLLKDNETLESHNIKSDSVVHCMISKNVSQPNTNTNSTFNNATNATNTTNTTNTTNATNTTNTTNFGQFSNLFNQATMGNQIPNMDQMMQNPQMMQMIQQMIQDPVAREQAINNYLQTIGMSNNPEMQQSISNMMNSFYTNPESMQMAQQFLQQNSNLTGSNSTNLTQPITTPPIVPPAPEGQNYNDIYKDQLEALKNLGFTNINMNIHVLNMCNGNLEQAANILFDS